MNECFKIIEKSPSEYVSIIPEGLKRVKCGFIEARIASRMNHFPYEVYEVIDKSVITHSYEVVLTNGVIKGGFAGSILNYYEDFAEFAYNNLLKDNASKDDILWFTNFLGNLMNQPFESPNKPMMRGMWKGDEFSFGKWECYGKPFRNLLNDNIFYNRDTFFAQKERNQYLFESGLPINHIELWSNKRLDLVSDYRDWITGERAVSNNEVTQNPFREPDFDLVRHYPATT